MVFNFLPVFGLNRLQHSTLHDAYGLALCYSFVSAYKIISQSMLRGA